MSGFLGSGQRQSELLGTSPRSDLTCPRWCPRPLGICVIIPAPPELPAGSRSVWSDSLSFSPNPNPLIFQGPIRGLAKFLLHKISLCRPLCLLLRLCSRVVRASFGTALLTSAKWAPEQGNGARAAVGLGCDGRLGSWEMGVRRSQNNEDRARGVTTDSS